MTKPTQASALLLMDFQVGIADQPFAQAAVQRAVATLETARAAHIPVFFVKVGFRPGAPEVAASNPRFGPTRQSGAFQGEASCLVPQLQPRPDEPVIDKKRVSAFAGNDLTMILRAGGITHLVLCGLSTSGVVLSTVTAAADLDHDLTVLEDACADRLPEVHRVLTRQVFPRAGRVMTVQAWQDSLG